MQITHRPDNFLTYFQHLPQIAHAPGYALLVEILQKADGMLSSDSQQVLKLPYIELSWIVRQVNPDSTWGSDLWVARAQTVLEALAVFKDYELNYNNYNYQGRFGRWAALRSVLG